MLRLSHSGNLLTPCLLHDVRRIELGENPKKCVLLLSESPRCTSKHLTVDLARRYQLVGPRQNNI